MKIVFSDLDHTSHDIEDAVFAVAGFSVPMLACKTEDDLIAQAADADIVLNQYAPFTAKVFAALPKLKQIIRYGVGVNNVDLQAASAAGVQVCNVPDYGMNEVSDHAVALSLTLSRKIVPMNNACRAGAWDYSIAMPIRRQSTHTVGLIGLGRIGRLYAQKMQALGFTVLGNDKFYKPNAADGTGYITEASVAAIYAFVAGVFIHRELAPRDIFRTVATSCMTTGTVMVILGCASTFARILTIEQIPGMIASGMLNMSDNPIIILMIINVLLLLVGCVMDTTPAILVLAPILFPVATSLGVDPVHFGIIMVVNLAIGFITPPLGINLFVAARVGNTTLSRVIQGIVPFVIAMIFSLIIITYVPAVSIGLSSLAGN